MESMEETGGIPSIKVWGSRCSRLGNRHINNWSRHDGQGLDWLVWRLIWCIRGLTFWRFSLMLRHHTATICFNWIFWGFLIFLVQKAMQEWEQDRIKQLGNWLLDPCFQACCQVGRQGILAIFNLSQSFRLFSEQETLLDYLTQEYLVHPLSGSLHLPQQLKTSSEQLMSHCGTVHSPDNPEFVGLVKIISFLICFLQLSTPWGIWQTSDEFSRE